jgi:hypothetical protein
MVGVAEDAVYVGIAALLVIAGVTRQQLGQPITLLSVSPRSVTRPGM